MSAPQVLRFGIDSVLKILNKRITDLMSDRGDCRTALATPGLLKLDGVGPVDNRPSTDYLHHFVQKEKKKRRRKM